MTTFVTIAGLLKHPNLPADLKRDIENHSILGLKENQKLIYFKYINIPKDGHNFYIKDKMTGAFIPLKEDYFFTSFIDIVLNNKKQSYLFRCFICSKFHNDRPETHIYDTTINQQIHRCNECFYASLAREKKERELHFKLTSPKNWSKERGKPGFYCVFNVKSCPNGIGDFKDAIQKNENSVIDIREITQAGQDRHIKCFFTGMFIKLLKSRWLF